jgi:hypothetical protein
MKIISVLILTLATQACAAKESHIATAINLYSGCVTGTLQSIEHPTNKDDIKDILSYTEDWCTMWVDAWYPEFVSEDSAPELNFRELIRFAAFRSQLKNNLQREYEIFLTSKKK